MSDLGWEGGVTIAVLIVGLIVMAGDWVGPDFVFAAMVAFLTACRIITTNQATAGFASSGLLTVVVLYVVAEGIGQTGGMERALNVFLGRTPSTFWAVTRMFIPVVVTSAFLNNTPIVALLIPIMIAWGRRNGISPKKLLLPLSYAAVFGGTLTLIGTSTNLVVSSLQEKRYAKTRPDDASFNFFYITPYGIVYAIGGFLFTVFASLFLLPAEDTKRHTDLLFAAKVGPNSTVANATVRNGGLKGMERLFLVAVERHGHVTHAVGPDFLLEEGDTLYFCGELNQAKLYAKNFGLDLLTHESEAGEGKGFSRAANPGQLENASNDSELPAKLVQATVKKGTDIIGRSIRDLGFRSRFNGAVLAVKRGLKNQAGKLGDVEVEAGDVFVILAENKNAVESPEFRAVFKEVEPLETTLEKEYLTGMRVTSDFKGAGKSIHAAGLRGIQGLYLVGIDRANGEQLRVVDPDTVVLKDDILWFAGGVDGIYFLLKMPGLQHSQARQVHKLSTDILYRQLVQASVAYESPLVGQTVREARFRNKYDAVVLAVHREGFSVSSDVRDVKLRPGDVLLLDTGSNFPHLHRNDTAFSLISRVPDTSPLKTSRVWIALALGGAMIGTQIVGGAMDEEHINLFIAAILTAGLMLITKCFNADQARNSIDWRVYVTIAFAFAFSTAMEVSGVAKEIADVFIDISEAIGGKKASFVAIYVATALLSELVSNNAAAALMYPIAARLGDALKVVPSRMSVVVMLGASAGFVLPYSYQTNLMVFAAGDYRFSEFAKVGLPCQLFMIVTTTFIFAFEDNIWVAVAIALIAMVAVMFGPMVWSLLPRDAREKLTPAFIKAKRPLPLDVAIGNKTKGAA